MYVDFFYFFGNKPSVPLEHIKLKLLLNINKTILTNLYPLKKYIDLVSSIELLTIYFIFMKLLLKLLGFLISLFSLNYFSPN